MNQMWIDGLSILLGASAIFEFVSLTLLGFKANYGRYSSADGTFFRVNARIAWVVQESPSVFVPLFVVLTSSPTLSYNWTNFVMVGLFTGHYILRLSVILFQYVYSNKVDPFLKDFCLLCFNSRW